MKKNKTNSSLIKQIAKECHVVRLVDDAMALVQELKGTYRPQEKRPQSPGNVYQHNGNEARGIQLNKLVSMVASPYEYYSFRQRLIREGVVEGLIIFYLRRYRETSAMVEDGLDNEVDPKDMAIFIGRFETASQRLLDLL